MLRNRSPINDFVGTLCTAGSALLLFYNIVHNYMQYGMQPSETVLKDPLSSLFTILPITIGVLIRLFEVVKGGFGCLEILACIVRPIARLAGIFLSLMLIFSLEMDTGLDLPVGLTFPKKYLFLLALGVLSGILFAYIDGEDFLDYVIRENMIIFSVLCIVNGCIQTRASLDMILADGICVPMAWIEGMIFFSILYALLALFYLFFGIIGAILYPLGLMK